LELTDEEFAAVTAPADRRYEYFLKRIANSEVVWSLSQEEQFALKERDRAE